MWKELNLTNSPVLVAQPIGPYWSGPWNAVLVMTWMVTDEVLGGWSQTLLFNSELVRVIKQAWWHCRAVILNTVTCTQFHKLCNLRGRKCKQTEGISLRSVQWKIRGTTQDYGPHEDLMMGPTTPGPMESSVGVSIFKPLPEFTRWGALPFGWTLHQSSRSLWLLKIQWHLMQRRGSTMVLLLFQTGHLNSYLCSLVWNMPSRKWSPQHGKFENTMSNSTMHVFETWYSDTPYPVLFLYCFDLFWM